MAVTFTHLTDKYVEAQVGRSTAKLQIVLIGGVLYRKDEGQWKAYDHQEVASDGEGMVLDNGG